MSHIAEERYISLLTDFGFKRIFGTKPNKDLLINFLNSLFGKEQVIMDVKYLNSEHVGDVYTDRKAIFDVYCENEKGEKFIVEMQNAYQTYFKDRSLYYATFPIKEQAPKSADWDFNLSHVYVVAVYRNDKLTFKYVEIAKFDKPLEKLREYEDSLKAYRDIKNSLDTAEEKGRKKGKEEGKIERSVEIAREMLQDGESIEKIIRYTGLSENEISGL